MKPQEQLFIQIAVADKLLTNDQIPHIMQIQQEYSQMGEEVPIQSIVAGKYLLPEQIFHVLKRMRDILQNKEKPAGANEVTKVDVPLNEKTGVNLGTIANQEMQQTLETLNKREKYQQFMEEMSQSKNFFGPYKIVKELGRGNMGHVFLVITPQKEQQALKIMSSASLEDAVSEERFMREARAMERLEHPNIVRIHKVGNITGINYFTMDYIEGKSLSQALKESKKLPLRKAVTIAAKTAKAIYYAHSQNIIHRDIKPDNIMLSSKGEPMVMDFGLARPIRDGGKISQTGLILGSPAYMAPEQAQGKRKEVDECSDVYSLGATFYELITGQIPFRGKDAIAVLLKVISEDPIPPRELNPRIPKDIEDICLRALSKNKKHRFKNALEMAKDLERFLRGSAIKSRPRRNIVPWLRKNQWAVILIMVFPLILFSIFVFTGKKPAKIKKISKVKKKSSRKSSSSSKKQVKKKNEEEIKAAYFDLFMLSDQLDDIEKFWYKEKIVRTKEFSKSLQKIMAILSHNKDSNSISFKKVTVSKGYYDLARSLFFQGMMEEDIDAKFSSFDLLLQTCQKAIDVNKNDGKVALNIYQLLYRLNYQLNYQQTSRILNLFSDNGNVFNKGNVPKKYLAQYKRYEQTLEAYNKALLSKDSEKTKHIKKCLELCDKLLAYDSKFLAAYLLKGFIYKEMGKYDEAKPLFEVALETNRSCSMAWFGLGEVFRKQGEAYNKEIGDLIKKRQPKKIEEKSQQAVNSFKEAIQKYNRALKMNPGQPRYYVKQADAFEKLWVSTQEGQYCQDAIECFNKVVNIAGEVLSNATWRQIYHAKRDYLEAYERKAKLYFRIKEYKMAAKDFKVLMEQTKSNKKKFFEFKRYYTAAKLSSK